MTNYLEQAVEAENMDDCIGFLNQHYFRRDYDDLGMKIIAAKLAEKVDLDAGEVRQVYRASHEVTLELCSKYIPFSSEREIGDSVAECLYNNMLQDCAISIFSSERDDDEVLEHLESYDNILRVAESKISNYEQPTALIRDNEEGLDHEVSLNKLLGMKLISLYWERVEGHFPENVLDFMTNDNLNSLRKNLNIYELASKIAGEDNSEKVKAKHGSIEQTKTSFSKPLKEIYSSLEEGLHQTLENGTSPVKKMYTLDGFADFSDTYSEVLDIETGSTHDKYAIVRNELLRNLEDLDLVCKRVRKFEWPSSQ